MVHSIDTSVRSYLPTLVVDPNIRDAQRLASHLSQQGFPSDFTTDCAVAQAAVRTRHYGSIVVFSSLSQPTELDSLTSLRKRSTDTWIIVINRGAAPDTQKSLLCHGVDALLDAPFSIRDLLSRLLAFSLGSRPS